MFGSTSNFVARRRYFDSDTFVIANNFDLKDKLKNFLTITVGRLKQFFFRKNFYRDQRVFTFHGARKFGTNAVFNASMVFVVWM